MAAARVADEGLAAERTELARSRTALAFILNGALLTRVAVERAGSASLFAWVAAASAIAAGALVWLRGMGASARARERVDAGAPVARPFEHLCLAASVAILAMAAASVTLQE